MMSFGNKPAFLRKLTAAPQLEEINNQTNNKKNYNQSTITPVSE